MTETKVYMQKLFTNYRNMSVVDNNDRAKWYTDQLITTHTLISKKICNIPKTSGLWKLKGNFNHKGYGFVINTVL